MAVYFDYVPSKANVADLPSRGDLIELLDLFDTLCMHGEEVSCRLPSLASWDAPAREWLRGSPVGKRARGSRGRPGNQRG